MRNAHAGTGRLSSPIFEKGAEWIKSSTGSPASFSSKTDRPGRDGVLELSFRRTGERTVLGRCRFEPPLQALAPFRAEDDSCWVMMLNNGGGMVAGDRLMTRVTLEPEAHTILTSASAAKAYRAERPIIQQTSIEVAEGAILEYLPDHLIPHAGARVHQMLDIRMARGSCVIIYDALAAGRVGRGERWAFREVASEIAITCEGERRYLSRARIVPRYHPLKELGRMENYNYLASLVVVAERERGWERLAAKLVDALEGIEGVHGGGSELSRGGCVARFLAVSASGLNQAAMMLWGICRRELLGLENFSLRRP